MRVSRFNATKDFEEALKEVAYLLELARGEENAHAGFSALIKSAILLLSGKFESFVEELADDCRYHISTLGITCVRLPPKMRVAVVQRVLDESTIANLKNGQEEVLQTLRQLIPILGGQVLVDLPLDTRLSFGKHGEKELVKLFRRFGLEDVFDVALIEVEEAGSRIKIDIRADVNSLINLRNNIIHGDASPSITVEQIDGYITRLMLFADSLDTVLDQHCSSL